jgi:hypothetical protein
VFNYGFTLSVKIIANNTMFDDPFYLAFLILMLSVTGGVGLILLLVKLTDKNKKK